MEIVIAAGGLPFGPDTLKHQSLGGSETAALQVAKALKAKGHLVTVFCNLPKNRPDAWPSGSIAEDGVLYVSIDQYHRFITSTEVDLLIVSRQPELVSLPHQARKAVLWMHDLATHESYGAAFPQMAWAFDEIWTVSEFHRQQVHKVTGYPLASIRATRNGIVKVEVIKGFDKVERQLIYAARPERGLEHLVRPDGVMSRLKEFSLKVCMYDNFPEHMRGYYQQLMEWGRQLPNVEFLGSKTQAEMRQLIRDSAAYVYPTDFEETSCILARECIEQRTPFITTKAGALPETLAECGIYVDGLPQLGKPNDEFYQAFADRVRAFLADEHEYAAIQERMGFRADLYWDEVADQWLEWALPKEATLYSRVRSLIEDSDIVPAIELCHSIPHGEWSEGVKTLYTDMQNLYPYLFDRESFADYYERYFVREDSKGARKKPEMEGNPRFEAIAREVAALPSGSKILDYGCAEGVIILGLAKRFPDKKFVGVDFAESNIRLCHKYAHEEGLENVDFFSGSTENWPEEVRVVEENGGGKGNSPTVKREWLVKLDAFDAAIASEVLEHVEKPWEVAQFVEGKVKPGGKIIITVPAGPWEATGLYDKHQWEWRAHIWHINKWMLRKMFDDKQGRQMSSLPDGHCMDLRMIGHTVFTYTADHKPVHSIDPIEKAKEHRARQTLAGAIIAMNSQDTILKMLNSVGRICSQIQVALGPSTDETERFVRMWANDNPWCEVRIKNVPKIEPQKFGFDDARNESIRGLDADWILWIDTDEFLSHPDRVLKYLRPSAVESYAIHQHHFTCDPRGTPAQLDKPARLFCNHYTFKFYGKVHEHAEVGYNGGPGYCHLIADADIGHVGYENEEVRRARFGRNFPLLQWDREVNPDRKLGHYLWMRDILHRMRYFVEVGHHQMAHQLALEAVEFYQAHWSDLDAFGGAGAQALAYLAEARAFLGRGLELETKIRLHGREMVIGGRFETTEELTRIISKAVQPELDRQNSRYLR